MRHFLEIDDLSVDELRQVLDLAADPDPPKTLLGEGMALVFEKPSARTRNSMEMAVTQLGGHPVYIDGDEVGMGTRETIPDVARTLGCYHAAIGARVFDHETVEGLADAEAVPVVNLLSDTAHPMQALADALTITAELGSVSGKVVSYIGDANNVARSLAVVVAMLGGTCRIAAPPGYGFSDLDRDRIALSGAVEEFSRPEEAAEGADVLYTDAWTSMGQEAQRGERLKAFEGFGVNTAMVDSMAPGGIVLHCLPAHRGEEVDADVIDGPASRVWAQAENRMHAARGLLAWLLDPQTQT
jgi:ornithine carbamoyltransferase